MIVEGVFVIKITDVFITLEGNRVLLENGGYLEVSRDWCRVHMPKAGGYLTQCNDGYLSYCPEIGRASCRERV